MVEILPILNTSKWSCCSVPSFRILALEIKDPKLTRTARTLLLSGLVLGILAAITAIFFSASFYYLRAKPFETPAGSMRPTLQQGDSFLVSQIFPIIGERYAPERGDIVVFRHPQNQGVTYVKRVIGLPGERIQMKNGEVYLNGQPFDRQKAEAIEEKSRDGQVSLVQTYREILPNGRSHEVIDLQVDSRFDETPEFEVPEGNLFVLGDNRDNSIDSRMQEHFGFVPIENVTGIARHIYFSGPEAGFVWRSLEAN